MFTGERLRLLRNTLNLSQDDFGKRLGVSNTAISKLEKNERNLTEQMLLSICREFKVDYFWLTEGRGEMFIETPESIVDDIAEDYDLYDIDKKMLEKYLSLSKEERNVIKSYFKNIFT